MRKAVALLALLVHLFAAHGRPAAAQAPGEAPLGMNLNSISYFSPEMPFVDVFKTAREWIPQLPVGGPWNTGEPIALTQDGWPLLAPGQAAATLILYDLQGAFPGGTYTVLYEGTGQLTFGSSNQVVSAQPGKIVLAVTPTNGGIFLKIVASDPADPVRNIRVLAPGFDETNYEAQLFHPDFLERIQPFQFLRFMAWQRANDNPTVEWSERTLPSYAFQGTKRGIALEYLVELANRTGISPWFCLPPKASDDYALQFATYVRDHLDPGIPFYLEYANEVWNTIYLGGQYATAMGLAEGLSQNSMEARNWWYSKRSVEFFEIFRGVLGEQADARMIRVLSGQAAWTLVGQQVLDYQAAHTQADVYAIAPYFAGNLGAPPAFELVLTWTLDQLLDEFLVQIDTRAGVWMANNKALCDARGIELICYEAGARMAPEGPALLSPALIQMVWDANRSPRMHEIYWHYLGLWNQISGGAPIAFYTSCSRYSQWGAYGHLEYQKQPILEAPKYRALRDWAVAGEHLKTFGTGCGQLVASTYGAPVLGNPDFALRLDGALSGTLVSVLLGISREEYLGIPLPAAFGELAPGCSLLVSPELILPTFADGIGQAEMVLALPQTPALMGLELHAQWGAVTPGANPAGYTFSAGVTLKVQG